MSARFEICRGDDGWWARFRAANGRVVWVTETYQRRRAAVNAIGSIASVFYGHVMYGEKGVTCLSDRDSWNKTNRVSAEIREVDERADQ